MFVPPLGGAAEQFQALGVVSIGSHPLVEGGHGLHVVVEHVGASLQDREEIRLPAPEVGDEDLYAAVGGKRPDPLDGLGKVGGAAVRQVIAVHGGDHGEAQAQAGHGLGHPLGLARVQFTGAAFAHVAEATVPGADVAQEHEGGRSVHPPALVEVRAAGLLADRDQALLPHEALDFGHHFRGRDADLQPGGAGTGEDRGTGHDPIVRPRPV